MRDKFFMTRADRDIWERDEPIVLALRYDHKKREVMLAGSVLYEHHIEELLGSAFVGIYRMKKLKTVSSWRLRYTLRKVIKERWEILLERLDASGWVLDKTNSFRRLTR